MAEACEGWPAPLRSAVPVNVTVPAVDAERAHAIVTASGCRTAKVKVAEPGQELQHLARRVRPHSEPDGDLGTRGGQREVARRHRFQDGEDIFHTLPANTRPRDLSIDFESALLKLPDGAREIFVLHDVEGFKHHEIATMLEISAGTSKAQLHRARMMLRKHLHPA